MKAYGAEEFKKLFWLAAKSTIEVQFMEHMNAIKAISVGAYEHLMARNPKSWCRAFFASGRACESVENGMSESFNSVIEKARKKLILTMLEEIRLYMMNRFYTMSNLPEKWEGDICPSIVLKLASFKSSSRYWNVFPSRGNCFEVRSGFEAYKVDINRQYCTCRSWELCGYPCLHACVALYSLHINPESKVSFYFEKTKFVEAYKENIQPLNGSNMWEVTSYTKPLPPKDRRMSGRPSVKRKRHMFEKNDKFPTGRVIRCQNCLEVGHNSRSCKNPKQVLPPKEKKKPGRPRTAEEPERRSRGGRSARGARGGGRSSGDRSGKNQQDKMNVPIEEAAQKKPVCMEELQPTEETMEVPMSMDQDLETQAEVDDDTIPETQEIEDLRQSGYTEDDISTLLADEQVNAQDDHEGTEDDEAMMMKG